MASSPRWDLREGIPARCRRGTWGDWPAIAALNIVNWQLALLISGYHILLLVLVIVFIIYALLIIEYWLLLIDY